MGWMMTPGGKPRPGGKDGGGNGGGRGRGRGGGGGAASSYQTGVAEVIAEVNF